MVCCCYSKVGEKYFVFGSLGSIIDYVDGIYQHIVRPYYFDSSLTVLYEYHFINRVAKIVTLYDNNTYTITLDDWTSIYHGVRLYEGFTDNGVDFNLLGSDNNSYQSSLLNNYVEGYTLRGENAEI